MMTRLTTDRLLMRPPEAADAPDYIAFYGSARRAQDAPVLTSDQARARFARDRAHWQDKGFGRFVLIDRATEARLGMVGPHFPEDYPEAEIAWHLWNASTEGRGLAFEAACAARTHAFGPLGWTTAVSYIPPVNRRSIALAERLGCTRDDAAAIPTLAGWEDTLVYRHTAPEARV